MSEATLRQEVHDTLELGIKNMVDDDYFDIDHLTDRVMDVVMTHIREGIL
jgi:hypothetical protein